MASDYWSQLLDRRFSRRRALAATGAAATAAALFAACGRSNSSTSKGKSELLSHGEDTSKEAKRGGVSKWVFATEPATLDIHVAGSPLNTPRCMVYSDLIMGKQGYLAPQQFSEYLPDLAESWEVSPDKLQITFKLRQGVKWHNKPPVNGRALDMDDVLFSWQRFAKQGRIRTTIANAANPTAPVLSWTAPDATTLVMKLKVPTVDLFASLTPNHAGLPSIIPKETDTTFDIRRDMIGTGPWVLANYTSSVSMTFKRHPEYYDKERPYNETIEAPFLVEYAQRMAQFKAGNIYAGAGHRQEDIIGAKKDAPDVRMYQILTGGVAPGSVVGFGWPQSEENKAFKDERVRQALSMSYDRDLFVDVFNNVSNFRAQGLPAEIRWNSSMGPVAPWHLDPRSKEFGPNAKYYEYNVGEAKKLLAAAGYPNGVEILSNYQPDDSRQVQVLEDMARAVSFRPRVNLIEYNTEYGPRFRDGHGKFEGWAYISSSTAEDAVTYFHWRFHSTGQTFLGYDVNGRGDASGDPYVDSQIEKARTEFDAQRRLAVIHDLQRYLAKAQYCVVNPGRSDGFSLAWPALGNYNVSIGDHRGDNYNWWIDDTKPPFKRA